MKKNLSSQEIMWTIVVTSLCLFSFAASLFLNASATELTNKATTVQLLFHLAFETSSFMIGGFILVLGSIHSRFKQEALSQLLGLVFFFAGSFGLFQSIYASEVMVAIGELDHFFSLTSLLGRGSLIVGFLLVFLLTKTDKPSSSFIKVLFFAVSAFVLAYLLIFTFARLETIPVFHNASGWLRSPGDFVILVLYVWLMAKFLYPLFLADRSKLTDGLLLCSVLGFFLSLQMLFCYDHPYDISFVTGSILKLALFCLALIGLLLDTYGVFELNRAPQVLDTGSGASNFMVLQQLNDCLINTDDHGHIVFLNEKAKAMFGYGNDEVETIRDLFPDLPKNHSITALSELITEDNHTVELHAQPKEGKPILVEVSVSSVAFADHQVYCCLIRDISKQKEIEQKKNDFISTVSHELRTPLTSIRGSLGLMTGGALGKIPDKAGEMLNIAQKNTERLIRLINDVLDIEKIESGKRDFHLKPVPLRHLIELSLQENSGLKQEYGIHYVLGELPPVDVLVDKDSILQVMANLLSNAAKFSSPTDGITIKVDSLDSTRLRVQVIDKGPGIPKEFQNKIFSKFSQANASDSRQKGGTGLGLNICRAILEKHNSQISFENLEEGGACFFFELTVAKTTPGVKKLISTAEHILVCEDDRDIANLLCHIFADHGITTDVAHSLESARVKLKRHSYDAMTLDLILPDGNGITIIQELRNTPEFRDFPIIVVSAISDDDKKGIRGSALAVQDWLEKPIDENAIISAVKHAIRRENSEYSILHVEDDDDLANVTKVALLEFAHTTQARSLAMAKTELLKHNYDLVILDLHLPDGNGENLLSFLKEHDIKQPIIIFTADEVSQSLSGRVAAALTKSKTDNQALTKAILTALKG